MSNQGELRRYFLADRKGHVVMNGTLPGHSDRTYNAWFDKDLNMVAAQIKVGQEKWPRNLKKGWAHWNELETYYARIPMDSPVITDML